MKTEPNEQVVSCLTKREYFAAMIFSGTACINGWSADEKVQFAVQGADALIAELNK